MQVMGSVESAAVIQTYPASCQLQKENAGCNKVLWGLKFRLSVAVTAFGFWVLRVVVLLLGLQLEGE